MTLKKSKYFLIFLVLNISCFSQASEKSGKSGKRKPSRTTHFSPQPKKNKKKKETTEERKRERQASQKRRALENEGVCLADLFFEHSTENQKVFREGDSRLSLLRQEISRTSKKKCQLYASFGIVNKRTGLVAPKVYPLENPFHSSKHTRILTPRNSSETFHLQGLCHPVGGLHGKENPPPIKNHHSERAFFTYLKTPENLGEQLRKAGIAPIELVGKALIIAISNTYSSCSHCSIFLGEGAVSSLCNDISHSLIAITRQDIPVVVTHKGLFRYSEKGKGGAVAEPRFSEGFYEPSISALTAKKKSQASGASGDIL